MGVRDRDCATTKRFYEAECQDCGWRQSGRTALGLAAKHYDKTNHVVRVEVIFAVIYGQSRYFKQEGS